MPGNLPAVWQTANVRDKFGAGGQASCPHTQALHWGGEEVTPPSLGSPGGTRWLESQPGSE